MLDHLTNECHIVNVCHKDLKEPIDYWPSWPYPVVINIIVVMLLQSSGHMHCHQLQQARQWCDDLIKEWMIHSFLLPLILWHLFVWYLENGIKKSKIGEAELSWYARVWIIKMMWWMADEVVDWLSVWLLLFLVQPAFFRLMMQLEYCYCSESMQQSKMIGLWQLCRILIVITSIVIVTRWCQLPLYWSIGLLIRSLLLSSPISFYWCSLFS